MTGDTRPDIPALPSAAALRSYMRATGWHEGPHGTAGSLWSKDAAGFAVPHDDGEFTLRGVIARLAAAEGRTLEETAAAVAAHKAARLVMPADEFAAVRSVAEACGFAGSVSVPAVTSPAPAPGDRSGTATGPAEGNWRERAEAAESERDRFREQARILGDERSEWACDRCDVIHPWRDGDRFTAACPDCGAPMLPTSLSSRLLANARARAEVAEARLSAAATYCQERAHFAPIAKSVLAIIGTGEGPS